MSWYFYPGHWPALPPRVVCPDAGPILLAVSGWTWDRYIVILFCCCPRSYFCYYLLLVAIEKTHYCIIWPEYYIIYEGTLKLLTYLAVAREVEGDNDNLTIMFLSELEIW